MKKTEKTCIRECANVDLINRNIAEVTEMDEQIERTSSILSLAGNDTRLKILFIITKEQKVCVCDLSDILGVSVSAISQQLRKLKDGRLLKSNKEGQTIFYQIHPKSEYTLKFILEILNHTEIKKVA